MLNPKQWVCDDPEHVQEIIDYWKPRLGISDWAIEFKVKAQIDVHGQSDGSTYWILSRRIAHIELAKSTEKADDVYPNDMEMIIVHELLHVTFGGWHDSVRQNIPTGCTLYDTVCEQPIDQLAETLVLLRRSSGHKYSFEEKF